MALQQPAVYTGNEQVLVGNGNSLPILHSGKGLLPTPNHKLSLNPILLVQHLTHNLISISKLVEDNNCSITFNKTGFIVKDSMTNQPILHGPCRNGLYPLLSHFSDASVPSATALVASPTSSELWHQRLGHPNSSVLAVVLKQLSDFRMSSFSKICTSCTLAKSHKQPFSISTHVSNFPLELISPIISSARFRYYLILIDDYSRYSWLYPLKQKSEVSSTII